MSMMSFPEEIRFWRMENKKTTDAPGLVSQEVNRPKNWPAILYSSLRSSEPKKILNFKRRSHSVDITEVPISKVPRQNSSSLRSSEPKKILNFKRRSHSVDITKVISKVPRQNSSFYSVNNGNYSKTKTQKENEPKTKYYELVATVNAKNCNLPFPKKVMPVLIKPKELRLQKTPLPEDLAGTEFKTKSSIPQGSQSCDCKSVSSEDASEDEEEMSMMSFYKFNRKPISFGAFGTCVYSGVNTKDGRKVAIKKIICHTQNQIRQYKREVKYLLLLSGCQNIVKYLDVKVGQNAVYIMMELMEGTLETLVNQGELSIKYTQACHDIIGALTFLHNQTSKTIIHRDIKPRNILFVSSPRLLLKLADFGLSKMLESDSSSIGYNGGTRCWMAPEVHRSLDQFSTASDVFAAGLACHYLMTSRNPFAPTDVTCDSKNRLFVEYKTVDNILNQNLNVDSSLSPDAAHLIGQMLRDDKDERPNAEEVLAHPFFWSMKKKMKFLEATANQPEIFQRVPSDIKKDLESTKLSAQFQTRPWSKHSRDMVHIYNEMMMLGKRKYDTTSVAELLRFMRNALQHVSDPGHTSFFTECLLRRFVFLKEFKSLFIDVYEVVLKHEWDKNNEEIIYAMS